MAMERYQRHSLIDWFDQDKVRAEKIIIVGAGAVGNEVIKNLVLLGVGEIHVFDLDYIEVHNLTRTILFREQDIGRPKAVCAAERAQELDPSVQIVAHHGDFWETLSFSLLMTSTGVFCCVDNFEARIRLNRLCALAGVSLINVGIDSRSAAIERFPFRFGRTVPCYECGLPISAYEAMGRRYSCGWLRRVAFQEKKIPTTILTSSLAASHAVSTHLRAISNPGEEQSYRLFVDTFTGQTTVSQLTSRDGCPGCSDLKEPRIILQARPTIGCSFEAVYLDNYVVHSSDRILTHIQCKSCDTGRSDTVVFDVSDHFDERFIECPMCGDKRQIGLAEVFSVQDLLREFRGRKMPAKFVLCNFKEVQLIFELEGHHGRGDRRPPDGGSNEKSRSHYSAGSNGS
jgi:molybdopterin/thiamine biosynthesis adenylyltransferase